MMKAVLYIIGLLSFTGQMAKAVPVSDNETELNHEERWEKELIFLPRLEHEYMAYVLLGFTANRLPYYDAIHASLRRSNALSKNGRCGFGTSIYNEAQFSCYLYLRNVISQITVKCKSKRHCVIQETLSPGKVIGHQEFIFRKRVHPHYVVYEPDATPNDIMPFGDAIRRDLRRNRHQLEGLGFECNTDRTEFSTLLEEDVIRALKVICTSEKDCKLHALDHVPPHQGSGLIAWVLRWMRHA